MRIIKQSGRTRPKVSLILLDWGVRESFHLLHYLKDQTVPREAFEVILIEYYGKISEPLKKFESEIDTWLLLEMPTDCYYHKHLMYNIGIVFSRGEILMIGDSDAMVRPVFLETIIHAFERDPMIVYHIDEFRNVRRDFYPFNYPSFEEVVGDGCINNVGGKTEGILDDVDPIHTRNYGACMCAWRKDVIAIGGADEDLTYLGHICGPYDMTFRLMNFGRRLNWETEEYMYHTWHPGSDGIDNYLGPHDGKNMSTTAFQALCSGRVRPLVENDAIRRLRTGSQTQISGPEIADLLQNPMYVEAFYRAKLSGVVTKSSATTNNKRAMFASYRGFDVYCMDGTFYGVQPHIDLENPVWRGDEHVIEGESFAEVRQTIDAFEVRFLETVGSCNICAVGKRIAVVPHDLGQIDFWVRTHRENPRIVWVESLIEARDAAKQLNLLRAAKAEPVRTRAPEPNHHPSPAPDLAADFSRLRAEMTDLRRQVVATEFDVAKIYESRTWRALTGFGGVFQRVARILRPQRHDSN